MMTYNYDNGLTPHDVQDLLTEYAEQHLAHGVGGALTCPACRSPISTIKTQQGAWRCTYCGKGGRLHDLIKYAERRNNQEAYTRAGEVVRSYKIKKGITMKEQIRKEDAEALKRQSRERIERAQSFVGRLNYAERLGLTAVTVARYGIGYDDAGDKLICPTQDEEAYISIPVDGGEAEASALCDGLYNAEALTADLPVIITDTPLGVLAIEQEAEGLAHAVAILGDGGASALIGQLMDIQTSGEALPPLVLAMSSTKSGALMAMTLERAFEPNFDYTLGGWSLDGGDAGKMLKTSPEALRRDISAMIYAATDSASARFSGANLGALIASQERRLEAQGDDYKTPPPFPRLAEALGGGFIPSLVVLGATSSLGKTAFTVQLATEWARRGRDVLYFSGEQSAEEIALRVLSRLTTEGQALDYAHRIEGEGGKQLTGVSAYTLADKQLRTQISEAQASALTRARAIVADCNKLKIIEGEASGQISIDDLIGDVELFISATGRRPIVIVDYLQLISGRDPHQTDKQRTDATVLALKGLSRKHELLVIAISSFNRESYNASVTMTAFKESGAVEYSADVLIGLQPATFSALGERDKGQNAMDEHRRKRVRDVQLVILKNRHGSVGHKIDYDFTPLYHRFDEVGGGQPIPTL